MPRQNRVTPLSSIIATPERGRWLGNRGCLHDESGRIRRLYQSRRWIICLLQFKGVRRELMQPGRWTELFFLDEATAFAAGHRPCSYCQRARYEEFRALWAMANFDIVSNPKPGADEIDSRLHLERLDAHRNRITFIEPVAALPDGTFVVYDGDPHLVSGSRLWHWHPGGYDRSIPSPTDAQLPVLTPRSVVKCLAQGFTVQIDPSAMSS
ncbi:MAG: hypothetical protein U0556_14960 [Dehalococcoidia bacterium]